MQNIAQCPVQTSFVQLDMSLMSEVLMFRVTRMTRMNYCQVAAQINEMRSLAYWTHAHIFVRHLDDVHLLPCMLVLTLFGSESGKISKGTESVNWDTVRIQWG